MAIAGIGTDIIELSRIEQTLAKSDRLARRILTARELELFGSHKQPARFLAKRFAAKEAAVKALGTGIGHGISWQNLDVHNKVSGAPYLVFSGGFAQACAARAIVHSHLSISDERHYAVATVVLEY
ncbi:holo-ACP synthase [Alteromonas lipotrueiana]|uniref:holo-ACP synthase n=1 Tax=Alteromonas lipotrueiana TaxID=2803815 RepID=UPI001C43F2F1|nr:holo-ACP synthase [Alteromonas lipotrueiana]